MTTLNHESSLSGSSSQFSLMPLHTYRDSRPCKFVKRITPLPKSIKAFADLGPRPQHLTSVYASMLVHDELCAGSQSNCRYGARLFLGSLGGSVQADRHTLYLTCSLYVPLLLRLVGDWVNFF